MFCPSSTQCMDDCAACVGFEDEDDNLHTCAKKASPAVCEERGEMLFCPSTDSCLESSRCQADCPNNPRKNIRPENTHRK